MSDLVKNKGDEEMREGSEQKGDIIASYRFDDGTSMVLIWDFRPKWVADHWEQYLSPRVKYLKENGEDYKYGYKDFYEKSLGMAQNLAKLGKCGIEMAREEVFRAIFKVWTIRGVDNLDIQRRRSEVEGIDWKYGLNEYIIKVLMGAYLGFHAEDEYLRYKDSKVKIGRDFNLIKYFVVLVGDKELVDTVDGRMNPTQASMLWNDRGKDGTYIRLSAEEKKRRVNVFMARIRKKFDPTYRDIIDSWE